MIAGTNFEHADSVLAQICPPATQAVCGGGSVTPPPHRTPSDVTRISTASSAITIVDTVSWSILEEDAAKCRAIMAQVLVLFPIGTEWSSFEKGTAGYSRQSQLVSGSLILGWAQFGAIHGKMWLYLTGVGLRCRREGFKWEFLPESPEEASARIIQKTTRKQRLLVDNNGDNISFKDADLIVINDLEGAKLTRVDIALDIYEHATFSVQKAMDAYAAEKRFYETTPTPLRRASDEEKARYGEARNAIASWKHFKSPVMPCTTNYESRRAGDDRVARTFYVGKLDSPKMVRIYDKGLQLIGKLTDKQMENYLNDRVINSAPLPPGKKYEEFTRVELVLRDKGKQELEGKILTDTDSYFAGGFPMLAKLLQVADGVRPSYIPRDEECVHARMIEAHRESYGGHVYFMSEVLGWSAEDIIRRIIGTKSSARLMVDQERPTDD